MRSEHPWIREYFSARAPHEEGEPLMEPEAKYTLVGGSVLVLLAMLVAAVAWLASASRGTDVHRYKIYFTRQSLEGCRCAATCACAASASARSPASRSRRAAGHGRGRDRHRPGDAGQGQHAGGRRSQPDHRPGHDPPAEPDRGQPCRSRVPRPGEADPVIAEGASQLQQFSETANELARRADETMRRINLTLSNENQAVLTETLVTCATSRRRPEGAVTRADAAPAVDRTHIRCLRRRDRRAEAATSTAWPIASTLSAPKPARRCATPRLAMRQISGDVSQLSRHAESLLVDSNAEVRLTSQQLRGTGRRGEHRGAQVPRPAGDSLRSGRSEPGPRGESMNRRRHRPGAGRPADRLRRTGHATGASLLRPRDRAGAPRTRHPAARLPSCWSGPTTASSFYDTQEIIYSRRSRRARLLPAEQLDRAAEPRPRAPLAARIAAGAPSAARSKA
jgi:hypothetical protein